jgi:hypothetical protein
MSKVFGFRELGHIAIFGMGLALVSVATRE